MTSGADDRHRVFSARAEVSRRSPTAGTRSFRPLRVSGGEPDGGKETCVCFEFPPHKRR
jgi:hypothetical protein